MKYIIDRLEEGIAVCENELKKLISIPTDLLPDGLKEGDVLEIGLGARSVKVQVVSVQEVAAKNDAALLYRVLEG